MQNRVFGLKWPIFPNSTACRANQLRGRILSLIFFKHVSIDFFGPIKAPWKRKTQPDRTVILSKNLKNRVLEHILPCVIRISSSAVIFTIKTYFKKGKGLRSSKIIQLEQAPSGDFRELSLAVFGLLEAKIGLTRPVQPLVLTYGNWEKSIKI